MPSDLLPGLISRPPDVLVEFALPSGWTVSASLEPDAEHRYLVLEPEKTVFFIGRALRNAPTHRTDGACSRHLGSWVFDNDSAIRIAEKILKDHASHVGHSLAGRSVLMLGPLIGAIPRPGAPKRAAPTSCYC